MPGDHDIVFIVDDSQAGCRLDTLAATKLPDGSRSFAANLIKNAHIRVHDEIRKPGYRVRSGDRIHIHLPQPPPTVFEPEAIDIDILYEDEHLLVVNKPPGLVVHPAPGHFTGTLVNGLLYHCPDLKGIGGFQRPGIVHRLDKDTSGALVVAKNDPVHRHLSRQFKSRQVRKTYLALVHGEVAPDSGSIVLPVGRHPIDRKKMSTISPRGRVAETVWTVRERFEALTLMQLVLKTGRTHQLRVHCLAIHHPIIGDPVYFDRNLRRKLAENKIFSAMTATLTRQMLHAWRLRFIHPVKEEPVLFEAPLPADMQQLLTNLRRHTIPATTAGA